MPDTVRFESKMMIDGKLVDGAGGHLHQHQPGNRRGPRRGRRRVESRYAPGHRRGTARVRRNGLVHQSRVPPTVSAATSGGVGVRTGGTPRGADPRGRLSPRDHARAAARCAAGRRAALSRQADRRVSLGDIPRRRRRVGHRHEHHTQGVAGAGRRGRRDRAVELPVRGHHPEDRSGAGHGVHRRPQAGTQHPVQRDAAGQADRREDRHPSRSRERRHRVRSFRRRGAHAVAEGRPDLVHRLDGRRSADHGEGRGHDEAPLPGTRRQVRHDRARGRRLRAGLHDGHRAVHARRPGLREPDAVAAAAVALRRGCRDPQGHLRKSGAAAIRRTPARSAVR